MLITDIEMLGMQYLLMVSPYCFSSSSTRLLVTLLSENCFYQVRQTSLVSANN